MGILCVSSMVNWHLPCSFWQDAEITRSACARDRGIGLTW